MSLWCPLSFYPVTILGSPCHFETEKTDFFLPPSSSPSLPLLLALWCSGILCHVVTRPGQGVASHQGVQLHVKSSRTTVAFISILHWSIQRGKDTKQPSQRILWGIQIRSTFYHQGSWLSSSRRCCVNSAFTKSAPFTYFSPPLPLILMYKHRPQAPLLE